MEIKMIRLALMSTAMMLVLALGAIAAFAWTVTATGTGFTQQEAVNSAISNLQNTCADPVQNVIITGEIQNYGVWTVNVSGDCQ